MKCGHFRYEEEGDPPQCSGTRQSSSWERDVVRVVKQVRKCGHFRYVEGEQMLSR